MMRALITTLVLLVPFGASAALGPYACHPAQSMYGTGSPAVWESTAQTMCAVWTCNGAPQVAAAKVSALVPAMLSDWRSMTIGGDPSPLNNMRIKYAKDDVCSTAMLPVWAKCRASLTAAQVQMICPGLK